MTTQGFRNLVAEAGECSFVKEVPGRGVKIQERVPAPGYAGAWKEFKLFGRGEKTYLHSEHGSYGHAEGATRTFEFSLSENSAVATVECQGGQCVVRVHHTFGSWQEARTAIKEGL